MSQDSPSKSVRSAKVLFALTEMLLLAGLLLSIGTNLFNIASVVYLAHLAITLIAVSSAPHRWERLPYSPIAVSVMTNGAAITVSAIIAILASL